MKKSRLVCLMALSGVVTSVAFAQNPVPPAEAQIRSAVLAAPSDQRAGATVYGYNPKGEMVVLRKGTNAFICLADDPAVKGFSASGYPQELEAFMARGRELRKAGKNANQINDLREEEVKAKTLIMPKNPAMLYVYSAEQEKYTPATGEVKDGDFRYVVYIPYATAATTGLPLKPEAPGMPWLMDPGTHRAHIMINPPVADHH